MGEKWVLRAIHLLGGESGKQESSLAESSPASPAQQSQNRQGGGGSAGLISLAAQDGQDSGGLACRSLSAATCTYGN